jgi:hypothetical protein
MPLLNRFWLYSDSWHVAVNSNLRHTMHGMAVYDVAMHDMAMHDMAVHHMDVHSLGMLSVDAHYGHA